MTLALVLASTWMPLRHLTMLAITCTATSLKNCPRLSLMLSLNWMLAGLVSLVTVWVDTVLLLWYVLFLTLILSFSSFFSTYLGLYYPTHNIN